jgi:hypothetical protein
MIYTDYGSRKPLGAEVRAPLDLVEQRLGGSETKTGI